MGVFYEESGRFALGTRVVSSERRTEHQGPWCGHYCAWNYELVRSVPEVDRGAWFCGRIVFVEDDARVLDAAMRMTR